MFSRYLAVTALSIAAIAGVRSYRDAVVPPRRPQAIESAELAATMDPADRERYQELCDRARRRGEYAKFAEQLIGELERGTIGLREATERLYYFCVQNYPEHLENAAFAEKGRNIKTNVARNLVRTPMPGWANPPVAARLERELRELPYEEENNAPLERQ